MRTVWAISALAIVGGVLQAQTSERRAMIRGGGNAGSGRCTVEVVVDGAAQVEIRGDLGILKNLNGQPPQWRRFECDSPLPANPANFRFQGVDGRGRQTLMRDPRQGSAIIQIEDRDNGQEGYTFDITWGNGGGGYQSNNQNNGPYRPYVQGGYGNNGGNNGNYRGPVRRFTTAQAVEVCQDAIRDRARTQFRTNDISFRRVNMDDQPGRNDWVVGSLEARRNYGPVEIANFSCSVNFDNGQVRSAQIDASRQVGDRMNSMPQNAIQNCQRAVTVHLRQDGYGQPQFTSVRADDQPGRNDWVVGNVRTEGRYGGESFHFSCSVDMRDGDVRSVDVNHNER